MTIQATEGVILRVIPFQEKGQILFLLTPDRGIIKLLYFARKGKQSSSSLSALIRVESSFIEKNSDLLSAQEVSVIEAFLPLRQNFLFLEVACDMLQSILQLDFVHAPCSELYALLLFYLKKIPAAVHPLALLLSFRLKLLKHEGFASYPFCCAECGNPLLEEAFLIEAELFCLEHRPLGGFVKWDAEELLAVYTLAESQSFHVIETLLLPVDLQVKVCALFQSCLT